MNSPNDPQHTPGSRVPRALTRARLALLFAAGLALGAVVVTTLAVSAAPDTEARAEVAAAVQPASHISHDTAATTGTTTSTLAPVA